MRFRLAPVLLSAALTGACAAAGAGSGTDAAVWDLAPDQTIAGPSTMFTALVSRLGCNNGVTGQVQAPEIRLGDTEVVVTFRVAPGPPHEAACPGNVPVPYEVDLGEPLRDRALVDGRCLPGGEAVTTIFCATGANRRR